MDAPLDGAPFSLEEYEKAKIFIEKYEDGNKPPTEEHLLSNYDDALYTDEKIWEDLCKEGPVGEAPPDMSTILSKAKESIVLVDSIPTTNREKIEKLKKKIMENIEKVKAAKNASFVIKDSFFPFLEDKNENEPYCLFQLENEQQAREFDRYVKNHKFTKSSIFKTYNLSTIDKYLNSPDEWVRPALKEKKFDRALEAWQEDPNDHFLTLVGNTATVYRNKCGFGVNKVMAPTGPEEIAGKSGIAAGDWQNIRWSPQGNYLLVIDTRMRGVGLFAVTPVDEDGNGGLQVKEKFQVQGAFNAEFSPDERHVMFQAGRTDDNGCFRDADIRPEITVYSVLDNEKKKSFRFMPGTHCGENWNKFQWSYDGRFLGTTKTDHLCIFDAHNEFKPVVDRNTGTGEFINVPGLSTFQFSPADNYVVYWVPEQGEKPLKVVIRDITDVNKLDVVRTKNLYKVKDLEMKWHPQGTYLALRCCKPMKGRKTALQSSFELFHIKEKEVPIDVFECEHYLQEYDPNEPKKIFDKPWCSGFEWEPNGNRFCVFYGPNDVTPKVHVRIFKPQIGTNRIKELPALERTQVNGVHWCPTGRYLILAAFRKGQQSGGSLEWIDADGEVVQDKNKYIQAKNKDLRRPTTIKCDQHQFMTHLTWDATGRYVVTSSSMYESKMENGWKMWNFQGKELYSKKVEGFCDFKWRPRPKSCLSQEQLDKISASIKDYAKEFQKTDAARSILVSAEETGKLLRKVNTFNNNVNRYYDQRCQMAAYLKELDGDNDDHFEDIEVQISLSTTSKVVSRVVYTL